MNEQERKSAVIISTGVVIVVGVGIFAAMPTIQAHRAKRAKVKEWEKENQRVVKNIQNRLLTLMDDPRTPVEKFWDIYDEEMKFLNIMRKRDKPE
jgi:hypothetical protein